MSFIVLSQASPESFLVIINDINLEATVTNRTEIAAAWIARTNPTDDRHLIVGISTTDKIISASPSSAAGSSSGTIATLQICCGNRCLVFSLLHNDAGIPEALADFLFDRNQVTLVGTGVRRGGDWVGRSDHMLVCRDPWELGEARAWRGLRRITSLDKLAGKLLGREKAIRLQKVGYWDGWPLSENQMAVACLEAYLLSRIGEKMVEIDREGFRCYFMCAF